MILTLVKTRLAATFSGMMKSKKGQKQSSGGRIALLVILFIYVGVVFISLFGGMFGSMCLPFNALGLDWLYYAMAGVMAFALCFIGSVFMAQHQIFEAKDNDLLLSMPIKPSHILISRMVSIFFFNLIYTLIVMLPALVVRCIILGMTAGEVILFIVSMILIPVMSMAFSCFFGWLIALISAKMKSKNFITLILSVAFMAVYFYFCMNLSDYINVLAENGMAIGAAFKTALPPAYWLGTGIGGNIGNYLLFVLCAIIPFALAFFFISRNFIKITTSKTAAPKTKYREKALKAGNAKSALLKKELKRFFGNASYMLNGGMGTILMIILCAALIINKESLFEALSVFASMGLSFSIPAVICLILCACSSMNIISASSISLEAKTLWITKSLPVSSFDILMAKAKAHFIACAAGIVICSTVASIVSGASFAEAVMMYIAPLCISAFYGVIGVVINLHMPKFDWINEVACVKQGGSVIVSMLVNMAVVALPIILYFVVFMRIMSPVLFLIIISVFFAVLTFLSALYLKRRGVKIFENL